MSSNGDTGDRVISVRNAWINAMRAEVLRVGRTIPEVARVVHVGVWIATYADADGSNSFPSRETLATLSGCSQETVTRAVKVLMGVDVLARKRRPNASAVYQLLIPIGSEGLDWKSHIHHMTETRQRVARRKEKERQAAEISRTASPDAFRTASPTDVPDSVRVGGSEPESQDPDSVRGRPRNASPDAVRTASASGVYQYPTTFGSDPLLNHTLAGHVPQPQTPAGEAEKDDESSRGEGPQGPQAAEQPAEAETLPAEPAPAAAADEDDPDNIAAILARTTPLTRCRECDLPLIRPGRDLCAGCEDYLNRQDATTPGRRTA